MYYNVSNFWPTQMMVIGAPAIKAVASEGRVHPEPSIIYKSTTLKSSSGPNNASPVTASGNLKWI